MSHQDFEDLARIFTLLQFRHPNANGKDYLSTLPAELLIQILANVPLFSYLDICRTSKTLKAFMHHNGRELCNARILSNYQEAAVSLTSCYIDGWITPTISFLRSWERRAIESASRIQGEKCQDLDYAIKITEPGPQFAAILEEGKVAFEGPRGGLQAREDMLKEVLERWNCVWGVRADGKIQRFVKDRRLAWFYGFPALTCVEKAQMDDEEGQYSAVVVREEEDDDEAEIADEDQRFNHLRVQLWKPGTEDEGQGLEEDEK